MSDQGKDMFAGDGSSNTPSKTPKNPPKPFKPKTLASAEEQLAEALREGMTTGRVRTIANRLLDNAEEDPDLLDRIFWLIERVSTGLQDGDPLEGITTKGLNDRQKLFLAAWARYPVIQSACRAAGIFQSMYERWAKTDKAFSLAMQEMSAFTLTYLESLAMAKAAEGDPRMIQFLLRAAHPEKYNQQARVSISMDDPDKDKNIKVIALPATADGLPQDAQSLITESWNGRNAKTTKRVQNTTLPHVSDDEGKKPKTVSDSLQEALDGA